MAPGGRHRDTLRPAERPSSPTLPCSGDGSSVPGATVPSGTTGSEGAALPRLGDDCWVLSGPTASGKTALAVRLAARLAAEIVSVDSMAVYAGLDIGTATPTAAEQAAIPHHCLDLVRPSEAFSVAQWLVTAATAIDAIRSRGRRVLLVGGTPLYLRSLRDGLAPLPPEDRSVRERLAAEAAEQGAPSLHARLSAIDPAAAARIHPNDAKRIVRALEVAEITGRPLSDSWQAPSAADGNAQSATFASQMLVLDLPRHILHDRIDRRVERMFAEGVIEETHAAIEGGGIGFTARQGAGYEEAIAVIEGRLSRDEAIERTKARTRQLAKRQLTWLRSFKDAIWIGG